MFYDADQFEDASDFLFEDASTSPVRTPRMRRQFSAYENERFERTVAVVEAHQSANVIEERFANERELLGSSLSSEFFMVDLNQMATKVRSRRYSLERKRRELVAEMLLAKDEHFDECLKKQTFSQNDQHSYGHENAKSDDIELDLRQFTPKPAFEQTTMDEPQKAELVCLKSAEPPKTEPGCDDYGCDEKGVGGKGEWRLSTMHSNTNTRLPREETLIKLFLSVSSATSSSISLPHLFLHNIFKMIQKAAKIDNWFQAQIAKNICLLQLNVSAMKSVCAAKSILSNENDCSNKSKENCVVAFSTSEINGDKEETPATDFVSRGRFDRTNEAEEDRALAIPVERRGEAPPKPPRKGWITEIFIETPSNTPPTTPKARAAEALKRTTFESKLRRTMPTTITGAEADDDNLTNFAWENVERGVGDEHDTERRREKAICRRSATTLCRSQAMIRRKTPFREVNANTETTLEQHDDEGREMKQVFEKCSKPNMPRHLMRRPAAAVLRSQSLCRNVVLKKTMMFTSTIDEEKQWPAEKHEAIDDDSHRFSHTTSNNSTTTQAYTLALPAIAPPRLRRFLAHNPVRVIGNCIEALSKNRTTLFGAAIKGFIECTQYSREQDPSVVIRRIRQFMTGLKNYLITNGEADLHDVIRRQSERLLANEFLNIDAIIEDALCRVLLKQVKPQLYRLMFMESSRTGELARISENLTLFRNVNSEAFKFPDSNTLGKVSSHLQRMKRHYSPVKKLEILLKILSLVIPSNSSKNSDIECHPSNTLSNNTTNAPQPQQHPPVEEIIRWLVYIFAENHFIICAVEAWYIWELLPKQTLTTGNAAYYLSALFSAINAMKCSSNMKRLANDAGGLREVELNARKSSSQDNVSELCNEFLKVAIPVEATGTIEYHMFPVLPQMNSATLCRIIATKFTITNPGDFDLYVLCGGFETRLKHEELPALFRDKLCEAKLEHFFAYKRNYIKIGWPRQSSA